MKVNSWLPAVVLFIVQLFLVLQGARYFGKLLNPFLLFFVSMSIPAYVTWILLKKSPSSAIHEPTRLGKFWWVFGGIGAFLLTYEEFRKGFHRLKDFASTSDTIPQAQILFDRFINGEYPYAPIPFAGYVLEPIYMPFHWLPAGLTHLLPVDVRFIGWAFVVMAAGVWGYALSKNTGSVWPRLIALFLPVLVLFGSLRFAKGDLTVTYELVIVAYYLVLAAGLLSGNLWVVIAGCVMCLMSRFTLVFWLPLMIYVFYFEMGWKKTIMVAGTLGLSVLIFYIIPFYLEDPKAIERGLTYYMNATVDDWKGSGDPPVSWTQELGVNFSPVFKATFPGDIASRVAIARKLQAIALLITLAMSIWTYHRWKNKLQYYAFLLIALNVIMAVYFAFAPLTYRYYLVPFLMVSAAVVALLVLMDTGTSVRKLETSTD